MRWGIARAGTLLFLGTCLASAWCPKGRVAAADPPPVDDVQTFRGPVLAIVKRHCLSCHGPRKQEAELDLGRFPDHASVLAQPAPWRTVLDMIESDAMPPADRPRLTAEEKRTLVRYLERTLYQLDCERDSAVDPGRVTIRRLNRVEYNNTVRDLLGVDFRPADDFPTDDVGHGFDNIGDVLSVSPLLVEKYLGSAERVAASAVAQATPPQAEKRLRRGRELEAEGSARLSPFGIYSITSRGSVTARFQVERRGDYFLRVRAAGQRAGDELPKLELQLDGRVVRTFDVAAPADRPAEHEIRLPLEPGERRFSAHFINDFYQPDAPQRDQRDRNLFVGAFELEGPLDERPTTERRTHLTLVLPERGRAPVDAARLTLAPVVRRAFRRAPRDSEVDAYARLVQQAVERGVSYPRGLEVALTALLVSPHFLFRVERDQAPEDPRDRHAVSDFELASRLSYFLWSSMPDDELLEAAERGRLRDEAVLLEQTRRLLADPRSVALAENFAAQWLNLRGLDEVTPDPQQFPDFSAALRADMRRETELVFDAILRDDRSLLELLDADFTFVNERLARHYGLSGIKGKEFRRASLRGTKRAGVLTHASVLTLTSNPTRTSPVKRGKWILENILGTPPPDPPPNAPELAATQKAAPDATLRQQLELHRRDPNCAVCHLQMDALGFGFENFDALGRWRERDGNQPVDAAGTLPDGAKFQGPGELVAILKSRRAEFTRTVAQRMLTYALGRGLEAADRCVVERIVRQTHEGGDRLSAMIESIVRSEPFRMRRGEETQR
ncbi:MAG: DUF1592 domain-containing protein [Pirellulales bacterium]